MNDFVKSSLLSEFAGPSPLVRILQLYCNFVCILWRRNHICRAQDTMCIRLSHQHEIGDRTRQFMQSASPFSCTVNYRSSPGREPSGPTVPGLGPDLGNWAPKTTYCTSVGKQVAEHSYRGSSRMPAWDDGDFCRHYRTIHVLNSLVVFPWKLMHTCPTSPGVFP